MKHIPLPKKFIIEEAIKGKKAKVVIEPCFPGYGMTLGNALRRVLLSSLPGAAIVATKIRGVQHEFSTLEHVSEDIVDIILNLKQVRFKMYTDEPVVLKLSVKGEGKVTAGDFEKNSDAEVINNDQHIATLNNKDAKFEMEVTVNKGIGYVPTEEQESGKGEIGLMLVDAIYTPVLNVGLDVEVTRVGKKTDYDKIILNIETDGTISPEEAVKKSAEILANQFSWILEGGTKEIEEINIEEPVKIPENTLRESVAAEPIVTTEAEEVSEEIEEEQKDDAPKKRGRPKKSE